MIMETWLGPDWTTATYYQPVGSTLVGGLKRTTAPIHCPALWYGPERGWEPVKVKK